MMYKFLSLCIAFISAISFSNGQTPAIYSIDRSHAPMRALVTLHGANFGTDPTALKVFFGGTEAVVITTSDQLLEVLVPAGASSDPISVTNVMTGRTGYYTGQFLINYQGLHGITGATFAAQVDTQAGTGLDDLCVCDLDGDGRPDVATANTKESFINILRNTSTPGNVSFTDNQAYLNAFTQHIRCADLNGDGFPDLVVSEHFESGGARIYVLTNRGNNDMKFSTNVVTIPGTGVRVKQLAIADLDSDGRPEIVVSNTAGNTIHVLPNQSTTASVSFGQPVVLTAPGAPSTDAITTADLDGDGLPEILTSHFPADMESRLYIFSNRGALTFQGPQVIALDRAVSDIRLVDLNADARPELLLARQLMGDIRVYKNQSGSGIAFDAPLSFPTGALPVSMDVADFDGDGRPDISIGGPQKSISILNNTGSGDGINFSAPIKLPVTYVNRNLRNVDIDGDGKPDIVYTSVDDNTGVPVPASKVSVIRNTACMVPAISPASTTEICSGTTVRLTATAGGGVTYHWFRDGNPVESGPDAFIVTGTAGVYTVKATTGACEQESNAVTITSSMATVDLGDNETNARSNSPVCSGSTLILEVDDIGATGYRWTGPDGLIETVTTTTFERTGFANQHAGRYILEVLAGTCVARRDTLTVEAINVPQFAIASPGEDFICEGDTKTLTLTPVPPAGFSTQWHTQDGGPVSGGTTHTLSASASGLYYAIVTPDLAGCAPFATEPVQIAALGRPVATADVPSTACVGNEVRFISQFTGDPGRTLVAEWRVDNSPSQETHSFTTAGQHDVTLTVSYAELPGCTTTETAKIEIVSPDRPEIMADVLALCEGQTTTLSVQGDFPSIHWNDGPVTASRDAGPGVYQVTTIDTKGCEASAEITITTLPAPVLLVSADRTVVGPGETVVLSASGADTFVWMPGKDLSDSTISQPVATLRETTTFTVTGESVEGCTATATVTVQVSGELVSISVPVLFSPNGDGDNDILTIEGIENLTDCVFQVFDRNGRKVYGVTGYQNNWNGTSHGTPLPEGVYFYVFGCPGKKAVTGSVTIIR